MPSRYRGQVIPSSDQLLQWLNEFGEIRLFALLDVQAQSGLTMEEVDAGRWGRAVNLYGDLEGMEIARLGPRLIHVDREHRHAVVELAFAHSLPSLLLGNCELADLAAHLQSLREVMVPEETYALFRYQDRHVTSALFPIIESEKGGRILGPLTAWAVLDSCRQLHVLSATGKMRRSTALKFDQKIVATLDERLFVHTVAAQVRETDSSLFGAMSPCEIETELRRRIEMARFLGLDQRSDQSLFCILSLQFPVGFETQTPFAEALRYRERGHASFGAALDKVSSEVWNAWDESMAKEE